eukprot:UN23913
MYDSNYKEVMPLFVGHVDADSPPDNGVENLWTGYNAPACKGDMFDGGCYAFAGERSHECCGPEDPECYQSGGLRASEVCPECGRCMSPDLSRYE